MAESSTRGKGDLVFGGKKIRNRGRWVGSMRTHGVRRRRFKRASDQSVQRKRFPKREVLWCCNLHSSVSI